MKTLFTLAVSFSFIYFNFAQTQITASTLTPTIGSTVKTRSSTIEPINYHSNGIDVLWDLSQVFASQIDSFTYINVADAQNPNLAPNASYVKRYNSGELFVTLNDSAYVHDYYHPYQNYSFIYDYAILFNLPMTYGNVDTNYYTGVLSLPGATTIRTVESIQSVEGVGTLFTPEWHLEDCIKTKVVRNFKDSAVSTQAVVYSSDTTYFWFNANFPEPVLSISINYSAANQQTYYYNSFRLIENLSTSKADLYALKIYPNPSKGIVYFKDLQENYSLEVHNLLGKRVATYTLEKGNQQIDLGYLESGGYLLTFTGASGSLTQRLIIE